MPFSDEQLNVFEADSDLLSLLKPTDAYKLVAEVKSQRRHIATFEYERDKMHESYRKMHAECSQMKAERDKARAKLAESEQRAAGIGADFKAFIDAVSEAVDGPGWEYRGQVVRDVEALRAKLADCEGERDQWKAHHADVVKKKRAKEEYLDSVRADLARERERADRAEATIRETPTMTLMRDRDAATERAEKAEAQVEMLEKTNLDLQKVIRETPEDAKALRRCRHIRDALRRQKDELETDLARELEKAEAEKYDYIKQAIATNLARDTAIKQAEKAEAELCVTRLADALPHPIELCEALVEERDALREALADYVALAALMLNDAPGWKRRLKLAGQKHKGVLAALAEEKPDA